MRFFIICWTVFSLMFALLYFYGSVEILKNRRLEFAKKYDWIKPDQIDLTNEMWIAIVGGVISTFIFWAAPVSVGCLISLALREERKEEMKKLTV